MSALFVWELYDLTREFMKHELETKIHTLIEPAVAEKGCAIVDIHFRTEGNGSNLRIFIEKSDMKSPTLDECAEINRSVSALLDVEDLISVPYTLEVGSPGIDRPLVRQEDFIKFIARGAKIELDRQRDNRKRFRGVLKEYDEKKEEVLIECEGMDYKLPYSAIEKAKLVIPDDIFKKSKQETTTP